MVPVMVMGTIIGGKFYSVFEYVCAGLIAVGISLFASKSSGKAVRKLANPNAPLGYFLCLANLILDGYTNAAQACRPTTLPSSTCIRNFGQHFRKHVFNSTARRHGCQGLQTVFWASDTPSGPKIVVHDHVRLGPGRWCQGPTFGVPDLGNGFLGFHE